MADPRLQALVDEVVAKQDELSTASNANDQAQAAAQAAVAVAAGALQVKTVAHDALGTAIDALVEYVQALK